MIQLKKILAAVLAACFVLAAIGCNKGDEGAEGDAKAKPVEQGQLGEGSPGTGGEFVKPQVD